MRRRPWPKIATKNAADEALGRADSNKLVIFRHAGGRAGDFVRVRITAASPQNLRGEAAG